MGREERKRKEKRQRLLSKLAREDPQKFLDEWNKRMRSWLRAIWKEAREEASFTEQEYEAFLKKFPHVKPILAPLLRYEGNAVFIKIDRLSPFNEEQLGQEAFGELIKRVKGGLLKGKALFEFINRAKKILLECGDHEVIKWALRETEKVLGLECCRALARSIGRELYRLHITYQSKN